jgi:hypothetical protein
MKLLKKLTCLILIAAMLTATAVLSAAEAPADEAPPVMTVENGAVTHGSITAGNNVMTLISGDVVKFGFKGTADPMINIKPDFAVDTAVYPILAIKARRDGQEKDGQVFYNEPGSGAVGGKEVNFSWTESTDWQWLLIDLSGCGIVGYMRFDMFNSANIDTTGMIAAVTFFKTVEDAQAFAATEEWAALGSNPGEGTIAEEIEKDKNAYYPLFDEKEAINTGWWFHPYVADLSIAFEFESPVWFDKIWYFCYAAPYPTPIVVTLSDENGNELFTTQMEVTGNTEYTVSLGARIHPGTYTVTFETVEEFDETVSHFVLGSGDALDDVTVDLVDMNGAKTNGDTKECPAVKLVKCEADPDYTEKPKPTQKPTEEPKLPTPVPTQAPTEAPTPTLEPTAEPKAESGSGPNVGLILGIIAGVVGVAVAVAAVVMAKKKKK